VSVPAQGLADFLYHPPLGLLDLFVDTNGPFTGNQTITDVHVNGSSRPVRQTYGVVVQVSSPIPPEWGYRKGWISADGNSEESEFIPPLGQIVIQHQLRGGAWVTTQSEVVVSFPHMLLWTVSLPGRVGILTAPNISFDLLYLLVI
jgi:hypothetical protein